MVTQSATLAQIDGVFFSYVSLFGVSGLVCLLAIGRARQIGDTDVRRGLVWLLMTTGGWSLLKVGYFTLPDELRAPVYTLGLVLGFATVWAWLYFCSAYTGRNYHRDPTLRRFGASVFLGVVAVKLTNPVHGLYFETSQVTTPFSHLAVEHGIFHWSVTGLSYALAATGMFMLFELYLESGYNTRSLAGLTGLIGVPVAIDVGALLTTQLPNVIYAPLGVAVFVLGVLYVFEREFLAAESAGDQQGAAIFLDENGRIRDYTPPAVELFPEIDGNTREPLRSVLPRIETALENERQVISERQNGVTRYYFVATSAVSLGETGGVAVLFSDITTAEKRRRELARHNQQLEELAGALAHELRNLLQIIDWRLAAARERLTEGTVEYESVETAAETNERMGDLVDDFTTLAKYGQTVERFETVPFEPAVRDGWWNAPTEGMELRVDCDRAVEGDPGRLRELFTNAFEFASANDAETVTVELGEDQFTITDDGQALIDDPERYLAYGEAVPTAKAGMKLPNVRAFARVHGWTVALDEHYENGIRVVVSDVIVDGERTDTDVDTNST